MFSLLLKELSFGFYLLSFLSEKLIHIPFHKMAKEMPKSKFKQNNKSSRQVTYVKIKHVLARSFD